MIINFDLLLQMSVLNQAKKCDPDACWWIKGDGVDVVKGLCESTRGVVLTLMMES